MVLHSSASETTKVHITVTEIKKFELLKFIFLLFFTSEEIKTMYWLIKSFLQKFIELAQG